MIEIQNIETEKFGPPVSFGPIGKKEKISIPKIIGLGSP